MPHKTTLTPGAIEVDHGSLADTKENIRIDQLIPSEILEDKVQLTKFLEAYYTFQNMDEFIYQETESFSDVVLNNQAQFRIPDPKNENNRFFTDESGVDSTLILTAPNGTVTTIALNDINVAITNGNELPGSLVNSTSEIGKTFTVNSLSSYNNFTAKLTTIVKYWVGPGPSYVMNTIEQAMDIDRNDTNYLELMQKEIAATIPRGVTVDKRNLYKQIIDFYKLRGSADSIEIFFRILFNDSVEVEFPYDKVLVPSSGDWEANAALTKGGIYLDKKGFLSDSIVLQDSKKYQKFAYLIKTGKNLADWELSYDRLVHPAGFIYFSEILIFLELTGAVLTDALTLSRMPGEQPGIIGPEDIPVLVEMFVSTFLPTTTAKIHRTGTLSLALKTGVINATTVTSGGSGYLIEPFTFNGSASSIVNITDNTIELTTAQQAALPVNTRVTYNSGGGAVIGGLVSTAQYFIKTSTGDKVSLSATSGGDVIDITTVGSGSSHSLIQEIITSIDSGTPSGFTTATLGNTFTNGSLSSIAIVNGGKDYNVPALTIAAPAAITFNGSQAESLGSGTVHLVDNTIKLTSAQQAALPVGATVTYDSGGGTPIGSTPQLVNGTSYFIKTSTGGKVSLSATNGGTVIDITSVGSGTSHTFTGATATATATKLDGALESVTIVEPGFGYSSAPAVTFNGIDIAGQNGVAPVVTIGIDSNGRLDQDNITITSEGSNFSNLFGSVAANTNAGKIASVDLIGLANKNYTVAPTLVFPAPQSKDALGNLLSTNVTATAVFTLNADGEISGVTISNAGNGYIIDPEVRIGSAVNNEVRVADQKEILDLSLNHNDVDLLITEVKTNPRQTSGSIMTSTETAVKFLPAHTVKVVNTNFRTIINNGYTQRKGTANFFNTARLYNTNQTIEFLGNKTIQTIDSSDINKYNTGTFVHIE